MAPKKRKIVSEAGTQSSQVKRVTLSDREKLICKKKLDALDKEESLANEDRFTLPERMRLLEAYNENGFYVFQDTKLLHKYFPNRRESDLIVLMQRLRTSLQLNFANESLSARNRSQPLDEWQRLCHQLMGSFARDKKVNLDEILPEALISAAEQIELESATSSNVLQAERVSSGNDLKPNYSSLLRSFAQLLMGRFPDSMDAVTSQVSMNLFQHINSVVNSIDLETALPTLYSGTWLEGSIDERRLCQEMALKGLEEFDGTTKKCPTVRDVEKNRNIEALCLELPKIKRITDVLNPLSINESLVSTLMEEQ